MMGEYSYYESKYLVTDGDLPLVTDLLESLYGGTDAYPAGVVDSVYFDSYNAAAYQECEDGDGTKTKLRVRRYSDDACYEEVQIKKKQLLAVAKYKARIAPIAADRLDAVDLRAAAGGRMNEILSLAAQWGPMSPFVRIRYTRRRYRMFDIRVTLDEHVDAFGLSGFPEARLSHAALPFHVLEIKSASERPMLPVFGLLKLLPISYSKFHLGSRLLQGLTP